MRFHKILCSIDFSAGSTQAMRAAVRLATDADAELVLAHVWYVPAISYAGETPLAPEVIQSLSNEAEAQLAAAVREATALGAKRVSSRLLSGVPWSTVIGMLDDHAFDLVVVGTHGRTGLARVLLGSVAENIVRHSPCSVIAIRPTGELTGFTNILCPVDFSDSSRYALDVAASLVRPNGALTLLHVVELPIAYAAEPHPPALYRDVDIASAKLLESWAADLRTHVKVPVTTRSRIGYPGAETLATLDGSPHFDLVVTGSHHRTGLARILLGSVAEKIVRHASCPVLVARNRG